MVEILDQQRRIARGGEDEVGFARRAEIREVLHLGEAAGRAVDDERVETVLGHHPMDGGMAARDLVVGEPRTHTFGVVAHGQRASLARGTAWVKPMPYTMAGGVWRFSRCVNPRVCHPDRGR